MNFIDGYRAGFYDKNQIDDFVESWHKDQQGLELWDYLGFTRNEYAKWVVDGKLPDERSYK